MCHAHETCEGSRAACGVNPDLLDTHSFKIGGATAMYHGSGEYAVVQRFGRWTTDTTHDYLWEFHERQRGLAKSMVEQDYELTAPVAKQGAETRKQTAKRVTFEQDLKAGGGNHSSDVCWAPMCGLEPGCLLCGQRSTLNTEFKCETCEAVSASQAGGWNPEDRWEEPWQEQSTSDRIRWWEQ